MRLVSTTAAPATLDLPALQQWLWDAACQLRGAPDAPKDKDFILPLVFLKRLSDVFDDELAELARAYGSVATAERLVRDDPGLVRFTHGMAFETLVADDKTVYATVRALEIVGEAAKRVPAEVVAGRKES